MSSLKTITLLEGQITIDCDDGGGKIKSGLEREVCPFCNKPGCVYSCDGSQGEAEGVEEENEVEGRIRFNGVLDGIESMLLGGAVAGLIQQSEDPVWNGIVQAVLDGAGNSL